MAKKTKDSNLSLDERLEQALIPNWDEPYKLPDNWCWTHWGNCGQFVAGGAFKEKYQGKKGLPIPFYKVGSLKYSDGFGYLYDDGNTIDENIRNELKVSVVPVNSILFAKIGEAIRLNRRSLNGVPCCIDNNLMAFLPNNKCYYKYVYYWSKGVDLYQYANATTVPAIRKTDLESIPFPLAPYEAQIEIVKRIESLFIKLDEAKEKAQEVVDGFETRKAAILHKAFSGELTAKWKLAHSEICEIWKQKKFSMITHNFDSQRIPLSQAERNNLARTYDYYGASGIIDKVDRFLFEGRKLLIGEDGANLITRSKPIAFIADGQYWVNNHAHVITTTSEMLLDFLCYYINSIDLTPYVTGSAQPKMTQAKMNSIPVPVPSIQEQTEIVRLLDDIICKEQYAKETAEAVIEQINTMKKAILARAFRGELGTNDPDEENAVELLKKILGGDAAVQTPAKKPTKRISIPSDIKELLSNIHEEEIIKLLLKSAPQPVSIQEIMSLSSKKFELMDALRSLEKKQLITKNESGEYSLTR